jgi:hypothetical protein
MYPLDPIQGSFELRRSQFIAALPAAEPAEQHKLNMLSKEPRDDVRGERPGTGELTAPKRHQV